MSFGSGITVDSFTLDSDSQITANITISSSATAGTTDVSVTTAAGTGSLTDGFTVTQAAHPNHSNIWIAVGLGAALAVAFSAGAAQAANTMRTTTSNNEAHKLYFLNTEISFFNCLLYEKLCLVDH